jgi:hypothetical protein
MIDEERNAADLRWCDFAAASAVDELLVAKLLSPEQAQWARNATDRS